MTKLFETTVSAAIVMRILDENRTRLAEMHAEIVVKQANIEALYNALSQAQVTDSVQAELSSADRLLWERLNVLGPNIDREIGKFVERCTGTNVHPSAARYYPLVWRKDNSKYCTLYEGVFTEFLKPLNKQKYLSQRSEEPFYRVLDAWLCNRYFGVVRLTDDEPCSVGCYPDLGWYIYMTWHAD